MRRPEPWQRLLSHVRHTIATPFVLRIGTGPPGSLPPVAAAPHPPSALPTIAANYSELSAFEKDYAARCLEYVAHQADDTQVEECDSIPHPTSSSSVAPTLPEDPCASTWRPLFDLLVLPDGSLCIGWFRHHALDLQWGHHVEAYVADLWQKAPRTLWLHCREKMNFLVRRQLPMRHRHLAVFSRKDTVSPDEEQSLQAAVRSLHAAASTAYHLEDNVLLHASTSGRPTLLFVRALMRDIERRDRELPTGTAVAVMQLLVLTFATYYDGMPRDMAEAIAASAGQICALTSDSGCHQLLAWGALLVGCTDDHAKAGIEVVQGDAATQALTLTLLSSIAIPGAEREAALRWHAEHHLHPLCDTLVSEEALLLDALSAFRSGAQSAEYRSVRSSCAATGDVPIDRDATNSGAARGDVAAWHFSRVLDQKVGDPEDEAVLRLEPAKESDQLPLPWLPGTGVDAKGCWCTLLTHSRILLSHSKADSRHARSTAAYRHAATVKRVHCMLRIALVRRCLFETTDANISSQYSILTHLFSSAQAPSARLTLIHLATTHVPREVIDPEKHQRTLMGLLFLFPSLSLRSLYGGTVARAHASLSTAACALQCTSCLDNSQTSAASNSPLTVRIPARCAEGLATRLHGRDTALICVVHTVSNEPDAAFLLDDLCMNLHTILRRS
ncbi:conserved hypothetical protein [Leishmania major strain Friedlin]|uniref:Uncharacterized protein n=1 Tax=Leishmania major TaxID=5664 RepID=E9ADK7_LEIMA|nr:conserved hypothetical protein [Leishmania major strain Friedlin]CAG9577733.1 hypothetical_protein_-_conserved [Leishmania major strain Friedlin]CBZ12336.1 conserved hypothetical protein [Leishmania major strain Friedlin]|eukprot:XP_003722079.1 conserved hypothetical protein [Leishmania major strain Friedlin]